MMLKITSRKELTLKSVLHVLKIRKNLMSESLLNKNDFCMVFESEIVVLNKSGLFIGKGYEYGGDLQIKCNDRNTQNK